jgi:hypothetical protein
MQGRLQRKTFHGRHFCNAALQRPSSVKPKLKPCPI